VTISVPIFATHYDGSFVISGSLTQDATVSNGYAFITDNQKTFFANSLSGRILTIQGGIDDGDTGIIVGNTPNTILVGGVSGGGGTTAWMMKTSNAPWGVRFEPTSVPLSDGSIVMMAGNNGIYPSVNNDVWGTANTGGSWVVKTSNASWPARDTAVAVVLSGDTILLVGGQGKDGVVLQDAWISIDKGNTWSIQCSNNAALFRRGFSCVSLPDLSVVCMGGTGAGYTPLKDVYRSVNNGSSWVQQTGTASWSARSSHMSVTLISGEILTMGGYTAAAALNDVWISTDKGVTWTAQTSGAAWSPRGQCGITRLSNNTVMIMGGADYNYIPNNEVWKSTDKGATWTQVTNPSVPWGARYGMDAVTVSGDSMVMIAGDDNTSSPLAEVWKYNVASASSGTIITGATSGNIYNIGGVSSEPTNQIVITLWENAWYT
jgi:hypothetical protein